MNKLYTLSVAGDSSSWLKPLACSNEVSKLKVIVFTGGDAWYTSKDSDSKTVFQTCTGTYPYYTISETPYVV